jgi:hypothetical protein
MKAMFPHTKRLDETRIEALTLMLVAVSILWSTDGD